MTLVVHESFPHPLNGRAVTRGEVLFGADADAVAANPQLARLCTVPPPGTFEAPPAPAPSATTTTPVTPLPVKPAASE